MGNGAMLKTVAAFDRIGEENAFAVLARATQLAAQGRDIINLGIGQPDFRTPRTSSRRRSRRCATATTATRRRSASCRCARRWPPICTCASTYRLPDEVMIVPGGKPTMFMSILMFGEPGAEILYPDPGFPIYRSMIEFTGAQPIPVPIREENSFAFSAEETLALITPRTRLLILNSPANPTGGVTPKAEIDKLVAGLESFPDVAVMSDEIYDHMLYDGETACLPARLSVDPRPPDPAQWLVEDLCDDRLAHGLRGVARKTLRLRAQARGESPLLRQCAGAICRPCRAHRPAGRGREMVAEFDKRRKVVVEGLNGLPGISCATPKGAFYASQHQAHRLEGQGAASALLEDAGVARSAGRISAFSAKAICACPTPTRPRTS